MHDGRRTRGRTRALLFAVAVAATGVPFLAAAVPVEIVQYDARERTLTPLPAWGHMKYDYLHFRAVALFLERKAGRDGLREIVRRTLDGEQFEKALDATMRWSVADLERELVAWIEHL